MTFLRATGGMAVGIEVRQGAKINQAHMGPENGRQVGAGQSNSWWSLGEDPAIQTDDMCGMMHDGGQVMADHDLREAPLLPEVFQQPAENLLPLKVDTGGGLVQE